MQIRQRTATASAKLAVMELQWVFNIHKKGAIDAYNQRIGKYAKIRIGWLYP